MNEAITSTSDILTALARQEQSTVVNNDRPLFVIKPDKRPSYLTYAQLSNLAYEELTKGQRCDINGEEWIVRAVYEGKDNYRAMLFSNSETRQAVLAHKGTLSLAALKEDVLGVYLNQLSNQQESAFKATSKVVKWVYEMKRDEKIEYHLSMTGHSLGAFLAVLSIYWCRHSPTLDYYKANEEVNAVTVENPGAYDKVHALTSNLVQDATMLSTKDWDVINIQSYPNLVNTAKKQIGTILQFKPALELNEAGWVRTVLNWLLPLTSSNAAKQFEKTYLYQAHMLNNMLTELTEPVLYQN